MDLSSAVVRLRTAHGYFILSLVGYDEKALEARHGLAPLSGSLPLITSQTAALLRRVGVPNTVLGQRRRTLHLASASVKRKISTYSATHLKIHEGRYLFDADGSSHSLNSLNLQPTKTPEFPEFPEVPGTAGEARRGDHHGAGNQK